MALPTSPPAAPPAPNPHMPATVAAGGGVLAGLLVIFLPLLQDLPQHVSQGTVSKALLAGAALIGTSVLAKIAHHFGISKAQITAGLPALLATAEQVPVVQRLWSDFETAAKSRADTYADDFRKAKAEVTAALGTPVVADIEGLAEKAAARAAELLASRLGGATTTAPGVTAIVAPAAPTAPVPLADPNPDVAPTADPAATIPVP